MVVAFSLRTKVSFRGVSPRGLNSSGSARPRLGATQVFIHLLYRTDTVLGVGVLHCRTTFSTLKGGPRPLGAFWPYIYIFIF